MGTIHANNHRFPKIHKAYIEIEPTDNTKIVTDSNDKIKSKYSIEYLKKMIPAYKITNNVFSN